MASERACRDCGARLFGPGARCPRCQAIVRVNKRNDRAHFPRPARIRPSGRNPEHLAWIRTLPCIVRGCPNSAEAAHVRIRNGGGMGLKPPDECAAPACHAHHMEQHAIGHAAFDAKYGIDMRAEAERLARVSPHRKSNDEPDESLPDPPLV